MADLLIWFASSSRLRSEPLWMKGCVDHGLLEGVAGQAQLAAAVVCEAFMGVGRNLYDTFLCHLSRLC